MIPVSPREVEAIATTLQERPDARPAWLHALDACAGALMNRLFFVVARRMQPRVTVDLGTGDARADAHLAAGHPIGLVLTIDSQWQAKDRAEAFMLPNLLAFACPPAAAIARFKWMPAIDLLLIRSGDFLNLLQIYRPHVSDRGLILVEGVVGWPEAMQRWSHLPDSTLLIASLGLGVIEKRAEAVTRGGARKVRRLDRPA